MVHHPCHDRIKGIATKAYDSTLARKASTDHIASVLRVLRRPVNRAKTGSVYEIGPHLVAQLLDPKIAEPTYVQVPLEGDGGEDDGDGASVPVPQPRKTTKSASIATGFTRSAPKSPKILEPPSTLPTTLSDMAASPSVLRKHPEIHTDQSGLPGWVATKDLHEAGVDEVENDVVALPGTAVTDMSHGTASEISAQVSRLTNRLDKLEEKLSQQSGTPTSSRPQVNQDISRQQQRPTMPPPPQQPLAAPRRSFGSTGGFETNMSGTSNPNAAPLPPRLPR
jgi:hypothetical protein